MINKTCENCGDHYLVHEEVRDDGLCYKCNEAVKE